ncbi:STAS domain-containing protein [Streptomyces sp. NPDC059788]|uniref:STAS domain-containing protein n=1 Tax=Streptomyces sp. NPDC059788 TaxID=3346948 RepID=UPI00365D8A92
MSGLCSRYFRGRTAPARRLARRGARWWRQGGRPRRRPIGPYLASIGPCWRARRDGGTLLLSVFGDLDLELARRLAPALTQVSSPSVRTVVLDLSQVTFFDCSGLQWLCEVRSRAAAHGGETYLRQPPRCVYRILQLVPLSRPFALLPASGLGPGFESGSEAESGYRSRSRSRTRYGSGRPADTGPRRLAARRRRTAYGPIRPHGD